jgi:hypothetical protein
MFTRVNLIISILLVLVANHGFADDLATRVRRIYLLQDSPARVFVSTHSVTTIQFPSDIEALDSDAFTKDPAKQDADFYISPGINWITLRSLHAGAKQNLSVILNGKVYVVMVETADPSDLSVLFSFPHGPHQ